MYITAALLFILLSGPVMTADPINDMLKLWNYSEPAETESSFVKLLNNASDPEYRAALISQIARTHSLRRNFDESHQHLDQADKLITANMPRGLTLVELERGRAFNSNGQAADALKHFRTAFQTADAAALDGLAVDAAHMIAIAEDGERAERWNLIAMAIAETSDDPDAQRWLGSLYNNLGWTYFDLGDLDKALALFVKGVDFRAAKNQTKEWQIARWTVARTWRELGRLEDALQEQLTLLGEVGDDGYQLGYINEELGELYLLTNDERHRAHFATAYDILSKDGWLQANEADRLKRLQELGSADD